MPATAVTVLHLRRSCMLVSPQKTADYCDVRNVTNVAIIWKHFIREFSSFIKSICRLLFLKIFTCGAEMIIVLSYAKFSQKILSAWESKKLCMPARLRKSLKLLKKWPWEIWHLKKIAAYPSIAAVEVDERFNYQFFRCGNPTELFWCWGCLRT